jgi:hypothetical protein
MQARSLLAALAVVALGLSAGSMLTEATVLVGYWRSAPPEEFLAWFRRYEPTLVAFYGTIEVVALIAAFLALFAHAFPKRPGFAETATAAGLSIVVLALYLLYFEDVNAAFVTGLIPVDEVAAELERWGRWQWLRTGVGLVAFAMSVLALRRSAE